MIIIHKESCLRHAETKEEEEETQIYALADPESKQGLFAIQITFTDYCDTYIYSYF